jgi:hypothetical protein
MTNIKEEFDLSKKECNILTQRTNVDNQIIIAICPNCMSVKSEYFVGKECLKCSVHNNENDPLSGWKKSIVFIPIAIPEEKLVFERGFFTEDVKEFIRLIKEDLRGLVFPDASDERRMNEIINKRAGEKLYQ